MRPIFSLIRTLAVRGIVGANVFQDRANPGQAAPYIVWSRQIVPQMGLARRPFADRETITFDLFAVNEQQRDQLLLAVRDAIEPIGTIGTIQSLGEEADTNLWRITLDADLFDKR